MVKSFLANKGSSFVVTCPILEVYVPYEYESSGLYYVDAEDIQLFAVANFRIFNNEKELNTRDNKDTYPLCIAAFISTKPREIDIDEVSLYVGSAKRKSIILRYYASDIFVINRNIIMSIRNMSNLMRLLVGGKLDILPYEAISKCMIAAQDIDNISLGLPEEDIDGLVAERCRDPKRPTKKARFMDEYPKEILSVNPREEINMTSTFNAFSFEDPNNALVAAHNRAKKGVKEPESIMEKIIKGEKIE